MSVTGIYLYLKFSTEEDIDLYRSYKIESFNVIEVDSSDIVLMGDSNTDRLSDYFNCENNYINRGIERERIAGVIEQLQNKNFGQPGTIVIQIGINDLIHKTSIENMNSKYLLLFDLLKQRFNKSKIYIENLFPVSKELSNKIIHQDLLLNERVKLTNNLLNRLIKEYGFTKIDTYSLFEKNSYLNPEMSFDGLHLNYIGYSKWIKIINLSLKK